MEENKATEAKKETYNAGHASPSTEYQKRILCVRM